MKLKLDNIDELKQKCDNFPEYDICKLRNDSIKDPAWVHFGAGNIFRGYIARLNQDLINKGLADRGISVVEGFDEDIIDKIYKPNDNLTLSVTLNKNGDFDTNLIANLAEGLKLSEDLTRVEEIFLNDNLQIVSFTITEKGYNLKDSKGELLDIVKEDIKNNPEDSKHIMSKITYLLYNRFKKNQSSITLLSLDNCSKNGKKLKSSIIEIAEKWIVEGKIENEFLNYIQDESKVSFPWSMIDKITPRPAKEVEDFLKAEGFEDISPIITNKNTYIAPFVNSEEAEYLVIEDKFANGRMDLDKVGVYLTDRDTVNKVETMKVTTCLNPLHTTLAVYGCLLGYTSISEEMKDKDLLNLIKKIGYDESLPVVVDPKILEPVKFIDEVINLRLPNPYIPDTPQRIATDTSQKVAIRFGETIKSYLKEGRDMNDLKYIPLALAGWLRYLLGVDDSGNTFELSPDPLKDELQELLSGIKFDNFTKTDGLDELLEQSSIFGVDLKEASIYEKVINYLEEMCQGKNSVRKTLEKYVGD